MNYVTRQKPRKPVTLCDIAKRTIREKLKHHIKDVEGSSRQLSISGAAVILRRMYRGSFNRGMIS